jgi:hypothetical protein
VFLFAVGVSLLSGFLVGLAPALRAPLRELEQTLRAGGRAFAGTSRHLHGGLVMAEVALAVVLLVAAGMLGRTLLRLSSLDPGFNTHNVLAARVALSPSVLANPAKISAAWKEVLDDAGRLPGVQSVALADIVPMRDGENVLEYWTTPTAPPPDQATVALASSVTPDYLKVMGIPLRQGRFLNEQDRNGHDLVVVIDEAMAQHAFSGSDPVGKRLWIPGMGSNPVQVVGVVGHVRHWGLAGDDQSRVRDQIYYSFYQVPEAILHFFSSVMSITVRTQHRAVERGRTVAAEIARAWRRPNALRHVCHGRASERITGAATISGVAVRDIRWRGVAAGVRGNLWRADLFDEPARAGNRFARCAGCERARCDAAGAAAKLGNDWGWNWCGDCWGGGGGAPAGTPGGWNAADWGVHFRGDDSAVGHRGDGGEFCAGAAG